MRPCADLNLIQEFKLRKRRETAWQFEIDSPSEEAQKVADNARARSTASPIARGGAQALRASPVTVPSRFTAGLRRPFASGLRLETVRRSACATPRARGEGDLILNQMALERPRRLPDRERSPGSIIRGRISSECPLFFATLLTRVRHSNLPLSGGDAI